MYPIPAEAWSGALELACYVFTALAAVLSWLWSMR